MRRRQFLAAIGAGTAAGAIAKPAVAQSMPEIKWRLTSSFPKSLDIMYGASDTLSKFVAEATDDQFQIQPFAAGEITPGMQAIEAVSNNTVEMCHTVANYFVGKDPTFALFGGAPFGLNARQQDAWLRDREGLKLLNEFAKKFELYALVGGNTGTQMGGWFRKEIKEVADLNGLKFRVGAWAGRIVQRLGGMPQQTSGGDIYSALEKSAIDAAEWVGPYDDEKLALYKVAKYYYYPGWEGGTALHFFINRTKWAELPKNYQIIVAAAAAHVSANVQAKYDARNPEALRRLIAAGTQLRPFTQPVMEAAYKASNEVNGETSAANADFKKIYESLTTFRNEQYLWWQIADYTFDNFMIRNRPHG